MAGSCPCADPRLPCIDTAELPALLALRVARCDCVAGAKAVTALLRRTVWEVSVGTAGTAPEAPYCALTRRSGANGIGSADCCGILPSHPWWVMPPDPAVL